MAQFRLLAGAADCGDLLVVCTVSQRTLLPGGAVALPWREFPAWLKNLLR